MCQREIVIFMLCILMNNKDLFDFDSFDLKGEEEEMEEEVMSGHETRSEVRFCIDMGELARL